jgi:hypothetical protein
LTHNWAPELAAAADLPAADTPRTGRGAAPDALAPLTPTVLSATPAAAATHARVMYLRIEIPPTPQPAPTMHTPRDGLSSDTGTLRNERHEILPTAVTIDVRFTVRT